MSGRKSSRVKSRMIMEKPCAMVAYAISYEESYTAVLSLPYLLCR